MWKNFKNITNNNKQVPPRNINHNGKYITLFSLCEENEFVEAIIDRNEPPVEENTVGLRGGSGIY